MDKVSPLCRYVLQNNCYVAQRPLSKNKITPKRAHPKDFARKYRVKEEPTLAPMCKRSKPLTSTLKSRYQPPDYDSAQQELCKKRVALMQRLYSDPTFKNRKWRVLRSGLSTILHIPFGTTMGMLGPQLTPFLEKLYYEQSSEKVRSRAHCHHDGHGKFLRLPKSSLRRIRSITRDV